MSRNNLTLFNDLFDPWFTNDFFEPKAPRDAKPRTEFLRTDVIENETNYELVMDVPGVKKENVSIEYEEGNLVVSVKRLETTNEENKNYIRKERHAYEAKRAFYVGDIDEEQVTASMTDGELHIVVPKEKEKVITKKQIQIS